MRSLQLTLVWLEGQPAVTSSPWLPLTKAIYYPWLCEEKELKYKVNSVLKSCLLTSALLRKHSWEDLAGSISHPMWVWNHSASPSVQRLPTTVPLCLFPPLFSSCCFSNTQYTLPLLNLCARCSYTWNSLSFSLHLSTPYPSWRSSWSLTNDCWEDFPIQTNPKWHVFISIPMVTNVWITHLALAVPLYYCFKLNQIMDMKIHWKL